MAKFRGTGAGRCEDLTGQIFGKLTCIRKTGLSKHRSAMWECQCECGNKREAAAEGLKRGKTAHCGCVKRGTHGQSQTGSTLYTIWVGIHARCKRKTARAYPRYGGRGITVDPRWDDFAVFAKDMGERPEGMSLDRIDNDGPYSRENCRWATRKEQARNTRKNRMVQLGDETVCDLEYAERTGTSYDRVLRLLNKGSLGVSPLNAAA